MYMSMVCFRMLVILIHTFKEKGIRPLLIKGIALAYTVYPHASLRRPGNDIDLLVTPEEFLQAREVLLAQGYCCDAYRFEILRELQCEETFTPPERVLATCDLWIFIGH
jgi:putative nucleotidyltransferase-like protein